MSSTRRRWRSGTASALAWHPSRPIVATGSADLTIKVWNLDTGRRLETLRGPTAAPRVLNFSPSGQRLACASEDRMVRIWEPKPLQNAVLDAPAADGWEDLLAKLKADEVKANGNGWTLSGGVLMSGDKRFAALPLAGNYARSSYRMRTTIRRMSSGGNAFSMILPVGEQQVAFILDANLADGFATGFAQIENNPVHAWPGALRSQQVNDSENHEVEISVRIAARTAEIVVTLDDRPLLSWSGLTASLNLDTHNWPPLSPSTLHFGSMTPTWVVSAVKVKRL